MTATSSRARARTQPHPRHRHFEQALRRAAAAWFAEKGVAVSNRYPYIFADRSRLLLSRQAFARLESSAQPMVGESV